MLNTILFSIFTFSMHLVHVAIVDTGYNQERLHFVHCQDISDKDFTNTSMYDSMGHGTNVTGILINNSPSYGYCITEIKAFTPQLNDDQYLNALEYVAINKFDIVNISAGGKISTEVERRLITIIIKNGTKIIAAAGNYNENLDKNCDFFPACYDPVNIDIVGAKSGKGKLPDSNYGNIIRFWEDGYRVKAAGITLSGTSQATPVHTARYLKKLINNGK